MKLHNPYLKLYLNGRKDGRTHGRKDGRAQSNMPLQLFSKLEGIIRPYTSGFQDTGTL